MYKINLIQNNATVKSQHLSNTLYKLGKLAISKIAAFWVNCFDGMKYCLIAGYNTNSVIHFQDFPFSSVSLETFE